MQIKSAAGKCEAYLSTDGYPYWVQIRIGDVKASIHHNELRDLIYVLERVRNQARGTVVEKDRHEFD